MKTKPKLSKKNSVDLSSL